jgi:hypothetical protein
MATVPPLPKSFEEAALLQIEVDAELERVCSASHFRTSKRACEFLRYIVRVALDGRYDSLKERSIGIDLLGRDASYDPSSDAIVRVRANDVRKRLTSYYATSGSSAAIRINLPTGSYVPNFLPPAAISNPILPAPLLPDAMAVERIEQRDSIPPVNTLMLMRPALVALLLCALLMRHRLEEREAYLRFWDHILGGRNTLLLSVAPQDRDKLASSLYPLVWIAGRYGVNTAMEDSSVTEVGEGGLASIQQSFATPTSIANDNRLHWILSEQMGEQRVTDRRSSRVIPAKSAALLTILPEDAATLHIQGTSDEAMRQLLEQVTSATRFPAGMLDKLGNHHVVQLLLERDASGRWQNELYSEAP